MYASNPLSRGGVRRTLPVARLSPSFIPFITKSFHDATWLAFRARAAGCVRYARPVPVRFRWYLRGDHWSRSSAYAGSGPAALCDANSPDAMVLDDITGVAVCRDAGCLSEQPLVRNENMNARSCVRPPEGGLSCTLLNVVQFNGTGVSAGNGSATTLLWRVRRSAFGVCVRWIVQQYGELAFAWLGLGLGWLCWQCAVLIVGLLRHWCRTVPRTAVRATWLGLGLSVDAELALFEHVRAVYGSLPAMVDHFQQYLDDLQRTTAEALAEASAVKVQADRRVSAAEKRAGRAANEVRAALRAAHERASAAEKRAAVAALPGAAAVPIPAYSAKATKSGGPPYSCLRDDPHNQLYDDESESEDDDPQCQFSDDESELGLAANGCGPPYSCLSDDERCQFSDDEFEADPDPQQGSSGADVQCQFSDDESESDLQDMSACLLPQARVRAPSVCALPMLMPHPLPLPCVPFSFLDDEDDDVLEDNVPLPVVSSSTIGGSNADGDGHGSDGGADSNGDADGGSGSTGSAPIPSIGPRVRSAASLAQAGVSSVYRSRSSAVHSEVSCARLRWQRALRLLRWSRMQDKWTAWMRAQSAPISPTSSAMLLDAPVSVGLGEPLQPLAPVSEQAVAVVGAALVSGALPTLLLAITACDAVVRTAVGMNLTVGRSDAASEGAASDGGWQRQRRRGSRGGRRAPSRRAVTSR